MAVAHTWVTEDSYDRDYVASHTVGFDEFRAHLLGEDDGVAKTAEWAEGITAVPARTIRALAREWAARKTTLSVYFGGPKVRGTHSHLAARLEAYVLAMQGIGKPGRQFLRIGAPSFYKDKLAQVPRYPDVDFRGLALSPMIEYAIGKGPMSPVFVPRTLVTEAVRGDTIEWMSTTAALEKADAQFDKYRFPPTDDHPGIRMVWNENGSQPGSWGHGADWLRSLQSPRLDFVVGVHPWLENDLLWSDLILPAQTSYEHEDLLVVQRSDVLALFYQEAAIEPVGESRSDYQIHRMIGQRLGLDAQFPPVDDWLKQDYGKTLAATDLGISWEEFKERKFVVYDCPTWEEWVKIKAEHGYEGEHGGGLQWYLKNADGLDTPSGKIEFVSGRIAERDPDSAERPPLARWVPHDEQLTAAKAAKYPLAVMSNHPRYRFHVQGDDSGWIRELAKIRGPDGYAYEPCWIHPDDAAARGIGEGDIVGVFNDRGTVLCAATLTGRIIRGAISIDHGAKIDMVTLANEQVDRGGCINMIAPAPTEKYRPGDRIAVPEMNVSGFLAEVRKVDIADIVAPPPQVEGASGEGAV
jgi:trimethylamine-N-oxide reductase (cytochrome c)